MPYKKDKSREMDPQINDLESFCDQLVIKAGFAYKYYYIQQTTHAKYYSDEDNTLLYKDVVQVNALTKTNLSRFIYDYVELHERYLDSPLTHAQSKLQAKGLLHNYRGVPGDVEAFKVYFSEHVVDLVGEDDIRFDETGYSSDDSVDEDDFVYTKKKRGAALEGRVFPPKINLSASDLSSIGHWSGIGFDFDENDVSELSLPSSPVNLGFFSPKRVTFADTRPPEIEGIPLEP